MIVTVNAIYGLNRDTGAMLYQLSYEATDVGSRSIVGSYLPAQEMNVNALMLASLRNCINYVHCDDHFFISFPQFTYDFFSYIINTHFFHGNISTHN